jgi:hypothetical protein
MDEFQILLDRLPNNGTLAIECDYTPGNNERNRLPGGFQQASLTLSIRADGFREFRDWLYNDNQNTLAPYRFTWTGADATIVVDLNTSSVEIHTQNQNTINSCSEYARQARIRHFQHVHELAGRGRIVRRPPIENPRNLNAPNENWGGRVVG